MLRDLFKLYSDAADKALPRVLWIGAIVFVVRFGGRIISAGWENALPELGDALMALFWGGFGAALLGNLGVAGTIVSRRFGRETDRDDSVDSDH